jgi:Arc/MetJ-type ribon-helix-helix transcriptional regulator
MKTVSLKLPDTLDRRLEREARKRRTSKAAVVKAALRLYLGRNGAAAPHSLSAFDVGKGIWGSVKDGASDLSCNPKHMEGFGQ